MGKARLLWKGFIHLRTGGLPLPFLPKLDRSITSILRDWEWIAIQKTILSKCKSKKHFYFIKWKWRVVREKFPNNIFERRFVCSFSNVLASLTQISPCLQRAKGSKSRSTNICTVANREKAFSSFCQKKHAQDGIDFLFYVLDSTGERRVGRGFVRRAKGGILHGALLGLLLSFASMTDASLNSSVGLDTKMFFSSLSTFKVGRYLEASQVVWKDCVTQIKYLSGFFWLSIWKKTWVEKPEIVVKCFELSG